MKKTEGNVDEKDELEVGEKVPHVDLLMNMFMYACFHVYIICMFLVMYKYKIRDHTSMLHSFSNECYYYT